MALYRLLEDVPILKLNTRLCEHVHGYCSAQQQRLNVPHPGLQQGCLKWNTNVQSFFLIMTQYLERSLSMDQNRIIDPVNHVHCNILSVRLHFYKFL